MSGNLVTVPPLVPLSPPTKTVQILPDTLKNPQYNRSKPVSLILKPTPTVPIPTVQPNRGQLTTPKLEPNKTIAPMGNPVQLIDTNAHIPENDTSNITYQITYPEDLNLRYIKQGRPKGKTQQKVTDLKKEDKPPPVNIQRTRSGRVVKTPKHIEKDFEKILITQPDSEFKTAKFISTEKNSDESNLNFHELEIHSKKRTISSRFRCSVCNKSYMSKRVMYQHLLKNPDHGPLPDRNNNNFDVWNYLVDVTQKCPSGQRGTKFCEELTNLLHNVQLLTSALFKTSLDSSNQVQVDKVLGNAIGLQPGKYAFDENELYKDVTVLKLIKNIQFFAPKKALPSEKSVSSSENKPFENQDEPSDKRMKIESKITSVLGSEKDSSLCFSSESKQAVESDKNHLHFDEICSASSSKVDCAHKPITFPDNLLQSTFTVHNVDNSHQEKVSDEQRSTPPNQCLDTFSKTNNHLIDNNFKKLDNSLNLSTDLLSDNSLLALPNLRTDEIMLSSVNTSGHLLDNSTSSDEMMNVDQFVNERFKKITEPDTDLKFNTSLNLDLPPLDLFQFHTS